MQGWLGVIEIMVLVALCITLPLALLGGRRRWLARLGGTFECSLRLRTGSTTGGWSLGIGRYNEDILEWFRFFSFALRPRKSFVRRNVRVIDSREPSTAEAVSLYADQRIVSIEVAGERPERFDLAMSPGSLTGLMSWLEASPPGLLRY